MQPGGSVKDRAALAIIQAARRDGRLAAGQTVVEMTSGNMGAGLGVVCSALGHPLVVAMSAGNSPARARMLEGLGAEVVLVDQVEGAPGMVTGADIAAAESAARRIAVERGAFYVDQFNATEPDQAHERGTGAEILKQCSTSIDAWVAAVGTGATFGGVARALKAANPQTQCFAVEPQTSAPLSGAMVLNPRHIIQGIGYGSVPPHWDANLMDRALLVSDRDALDWRKRIARTEGLYVGFSAAANLCAASRLMTSGELGTNPLVVTVLCDSGMKY